MIVQSLLRSYGAPVLAIILGGLYVQGLRSDNADLREEKRELIADVEALQAQAKEDAVSIATLSAGKQAIDETAQEQTAQTSQRDRAQDRTLAKLERQLNDLRQNPTDDGTVGPAITASLSEQRDSIAAGLNARADRIGQSKASDMPPAREPDGEADNTARDTGIGNGQGQPDNLAGGEVASADNGMGREGLGRIPELAAAMAKPSNVSKPCTARDARGLTACIDTLFVWVIESHISSDDGTVWRVGENAVTEIHPFAAFRGQADCQARGVEMAKAVTRQARRDGLRDDVLTRHTTLCGPVWTEYANGGESPFKDQWPDISKGFMPRERGEI